MSHPKLGLLQSIVNLLSLSATDGQLNSPDNGKYSKLFEERYEQSHVLCVCVRLGSVLEIQAIFWPERKRENNIEKAYEVRSLDLKVQSFCYFLEHSTYK